MRNFYVAAAILSCAACADSVDPGRLLVGRWGAANAELIAIRSGAELRLDCWIIVMDEPIELTADNSFGARGEQWRSTATLDPRPAAISGRLDGNTLELQVSLSAEWFPLILDAGVAPEVDEVPVCPQ